jgi:hypothetical protein
MKTLRYFFVITIFTSFLSCTTDEKEQKKADALDKNYTDCEVFVKEYNEWVIHYVDLSKLCQAKPENQELQAKKHEMSAEMPQWGLRRRSMVNCAADESFNKKCDEITTRLTEAMETYNF